LPKGYSKGYSMVERPPRRYQRLNPHRIQKDKVVCLACGVQFKQLTNKHLMSHGMSAKEYNLIYVFTMRTSLSAKSLTKAQSKEAKKRTAREAAEIHGGEKGGESPSFHSSGN